LFFILALAAGSLISANRRRQCVSRAPSAVAEISGLRFGGLPEKLKVFMQPQEAATDYLFKLWPWLEANAKRLAIGAVLILIAIFVFSFYSYEQTKKETDAGEALTQAIVAGDGGQPADACLKVAADYPGTLAGQRALLLGAAALFEAGKYADAQAQFQKFLDTYPDNAFVPQAELGLASSLDAQGKTDLAVSAYQKAGDQSADESTAATAKFAIARIAEEQGKLDDAAKLYADITRTFPNSQFSSEAEMRTMDLKTKSAAPAPATTAPAAPAANVPFQLSQ
jgi:predicted negative regulator of RcsB-dependent stress response